MSSNDNNTVYTLATIHETLTPSSLDGVMQLATRTYKSAAKDHPVQKSPKRWIASAHFVPYKLCSDDFLDDIRTLRLPRDHLHEILQQLQNSSKTPRQIRIDMLKAADTFERKSHRKNPKAFCLDATHGISSNLSDILYTLIIRDDSIGRGWPVAYMITNDRSTDPIDEWLQHLRNSSLLVAPEQYTIDCCQSEVNAITSIFNSNRTKIQFCVFHVIQAWNKHLASVSVPGNTPSESRNLYGDMMRCLQKIVYEEDKDQFLQMVTSFQLEYADRIRNKRLDKLVFVLVNDVEYYPNQEFERVVQENGAMSPFFKQQRWRKLEAEEVDEEAKSDMITRSITLENSGNCSRQPCKHMYLLKFHTNFSLHFPSSTTPILPNTTGQDISHNNSSETVTTSVVNRKKEIAKNRMNISPTLKYANSDLLRLPTYMTEEEATIMHEKYKHALQFVQQ
ncbi:hypothetical protein G6F43_001373 [Rhizopus delemar]|nr:hypothetical protein G6F43_001373 [Rhizopus delemar]